MNDHDAKVVEIPTAKKPTFEDVEQELHMARERVVFLQGVLEGMRLSKEG